MRDYFFRALGELGIRLAVHLLAEEDKVRRYGFALGRCWDFKVRATVEQFVEQKVAKANTTRAFLGFFVCAARIAQDELVPNQFDELADFVFKALVAAGSARARDIRVSAAPTKILILARCHIL